MEGENKNCGGGEEDEARSGGAPGTCEEVGAVVVVEGVAAGMTLTGLVLDEDRTLTLDCVQDIPLGHKVALKDMAVGATVVKYGVDIGKVVQPIAKGQHAHVHNIKTKRW